MDSIDAIFAAQQELESQLQDVMLRYLKVKHDTEMKKPYGDGEIDEAEEEKKPKEVPRKIMEESL